MQRAVWYHGIYKYIFSLATSVDESSRQDKLTIYLSIKSYSNSDTRAGMHFDLTLMLVSDPAYRTNEIVDHYRYGEVFTSTVYTCMSLGPHNIISH